MPVNFHQKHCIRGAIPVQFLGTRHCGNCGKWFNASDFYGVYDWKKPRPNTHWPYCICPSCWPNLYTHTGDTMYGPNFTNPMNQSGQFMSEINRLNNHKEAKQMKDLNTHMENQAVPFFPPPHQPKLSAESQEKYAAGNKTVEETIDRYTQVAESRKAKEETIRGQILDTAKGLTTGDRNKSYGPPIDNLTTYANLCTAYIFGKGGNDNELLALDAVDAAVLMVLAKVSRIAANRGHKDNYVDGAAYMAIAGECDELLESPPPTKSRCRENYCSRTLRGWVMESINPWFDPKYDPTYGYGRPFGPREGDNDYIKDQPNNYTRFA